MNEEVFQIGERVAMKVEAIRLQPELLIRPLNEDHVKELEESYAPYPNTHPAIIVQPFEDDYTIRAHAHTFQALVNIGRAKVNVRVVQGPEHEVLSYLGKEQALTKRMKPIEWGNYLLRLRSAMPHKSLKELEEFCPFTKARIHQLLSGIENKDVINLMDQMGWSFDKARNAVKLFDDKTEPDTSSVQQLDSKDVDESPEELTKTREASPEPEADIGLEDEGDDSLKLNGHPSEVSSVHPIQNSGKSEGDGVPKISPDGEHGQDGEDTQKKESIIPPSSPESSPSKPDYPIRVHLCMCGEYHESKRELSKHTCTTNGYQQYLNRVNRELARAYIPSQKNGGEYWVPLTVLKEMGQKPGSIIFIEQEIERTKEIIKNIESAFDNAKAKIGGS